MKMLNILLKVSHRADGKPGSINPGKAVYLAASPVYRASLQSPTLFTMKLGVCYRRSLGKCYYSLYIHLVNGNGSEWNEHVFKDCTIDVHIYVHIKDHARVMLIVLWPMSLCFLVFSFAVLDYI